MRSILDVTVSHFSSYTDNRSRPVNLLRWLRSDRFAHKVIAIRLMKEKRKRDRIKATLPAITISGLFEPTRKAEHLIRHSGLLCIDIDQKSNEHINLPSLKYELFRIKHIAYAGLSVSGRGLFLVVPIENPAKHKLHFWALEKDFKERGIIIDNAPQNVASLRGYSFDPDALFRHTPSIYRKTRDPVLMKRKWGQVSLGNSESGSQTRYKIEKIIDQIVTNRIDITAHEPDWFRIACAFANEFGEQGRAYFHAVSQFHHGYSPLKADRKFNSVSKRGYQRIGIGTFLMIANQYIPHG